MTIAIQQAIYFLAIAKERNFTRAAARCGVRHPSLSLAIKALEATLGSPLFERRATGAQMTALGRAVRPQLLTMVRAAARVQDAARRHRRAERQGASGQSAAAHLYD